MIFLRNKPVSPATAVVGCPFVSRLPLPCPAYHLLHPTLLMNRSAAIEAGRLGGDNRVRGRTLNIGNVGINGIPRFRTITPYPRWSSSTDRGIY